jgi:hypothetical protein
MGDACLFAPVDVDTVGTACTQLQVSSNGSCGTRRASLDYWDSGDCSDTYVYEASSIISYHDAVNGNTVAHSWKAWAHGNDFRPISGRAEQVATQTTADYEVYETGTMITPDSAFAQEMTWWAPTEIEDCHFVIQRKKLYRYDSDAVYMVSVGDFVDWDIARYALKNRGGYDSECGLIYQYGGPSDDPSEDCRDNTRRFGGIAMLGSFFHYDGAIDAEPFAGIIQPIRPYIFNDQLDPNYLYDVMHMPSYVVSGAMDDLYSCMVYKGNLTFPSHDTLFVYSAFISLLDGTVEDLRSQVDLARAWADEHLGLYSCCEGRVGDANDSGEDEPTIGDVTVMIDALFIGDDWSVITCLAEADINQSGGADPQEADITIGDISYLIDYLFITGPSIMQLPECL